MSMLNRTGVEGELPTLSHLQLLFLSIKLSTPGKGTWLS